MRALGPCLLLLCALAGCEAPPRSAYTVVLDSRAATVPLGNNTAGQPCRRLELGGGAADIYCGEWKRPSARIRPGGTEAASDLAGLATGAGAGAAWRAGIDARFTCQAPRPTSILGGAPAVVLECQYRGSGWPQLALVALVGGRVWYADTVVAAFDVAQASIGALAGVRADAARQGAAAPDPELARLLAARGDTTGDSQQYYRSLMLAAVDANRQGDMPGAELLYRRVIGLQEQAQGKDAPGLASAVMSLGLQLSNQKRYADAAIQFARADRLIGAAGADPAAAQPDSNDIAQQRAMLAQYRGIDALNQGSPDDALELLKQAEAGYREVAGPALDAPDGGGAQASPTEQASNAIAGVVDVMRDRAWAFRELGRPGDSDDQVRKAEELAASKLPATPSHSRQRETAYLYRTQGLTLAWQGDASSAIARFQDADRDFAIVYAATRPRAETKLYIAAELLRLNRPNEALARCREAVGILNARKDGVAADLMAPCLDAYAAAATGADEQPRLADMFEAAQQIRSSQTNQQIQQAAARMSENARDPKVAELIRKRDEANKRLDALEGRRLLLAQPQPGAPAGAPSDAAAPATLDRDIETARKEAASLEEQLEAASPSYNELVPKVASAKEVMAALRPGEAFAQTVLSETSGWTFLLRDGTVRIGRIDGGRARMQTLVEQLRATLEPLEDGSVRDFDMAHAYELYQAVLAPVAEGLRGATALTIAPAGPLLSLPFEVLLTGPTKPRDYANAPWLVKQLAIAHVPQPGNFVKLRELAGTSRATSPWFGFGFAADVAPAQWRASFPPSCRDDAARLAQLPRLDSTLQELRASASIMHAGAGDELTGPAFTAAAVAQLPLKQYRILHFAAHGLLPTDLTCQSEPAIVTSAPPGAANADGALLTASKVERLDLDAELVILSACNSGGPGGQTAGESLSGLARSFFAANARALLVSHWDLFDVPASILIPDALAKLQQSPQAGIVGALRAAQLEWMGKHTGDDLHPTYWGALAVFGEGGGGAPKPGATTAGLVNYPG